MTPEEIEQRVREEHPEFRVSENGELTVISPETDPNAYEAMITERVVWRIEQQDQETAAAEELNRAEQMKARYDALKAGTATAAQTQQVVAHLLRKQYPELQP